MNSIKHPFGFGFGFGFGFDYKPNKSINADVQFR